MVLLYILFGYHHPHQVQKFQMAIPDIWIRYEVIWSNTRKHLPIMKQYKFQVSLLVLVYHRNQDT
jgi:hypothetical protein